MLRGLFCTDAFTDALWGSADAFGGTLLAPLSACASCTSCDPNFSFEKACMAPQVI